MEPEKLKAMNAETGKPPADTSSALKNDVEVSDRSEFDLLEIVHDRITDATAGCPAAKAETFAPSHEMKVAQGKISDDIAGCAGAKTETTPISSYEMIEAERRILRYTKPEEGKMKDDSSDVGGSKRRYQTKSEEAARINRNLDVSIAIPNEPEAKQKGDAKLQFAEKRQVPPSGTDADHQCHAEEPAATASPFSQPQPALARHQQSPISDRQIQVGAFSATTGDGLERRTHVSPSAVGLHRLYSTDHDEEQQIVGAMTRQDSRNHTEAAPTPQAKPVQEDALPTTQARPYDLDDSAAERKRLQQKNQLKALLLFCICLVIVIVIVVMVTKNGVDNQAAHYTTTPPSPASLWTTSDAPSTAPFSPFDLFVSSLPRFSLQKIQNISTPQWKAMNWLANHPGLPQMPQWRMTQLFALVSFFFAMEGPHWRKEIREKWLLYEVSECQWYSSNFGAFDAEGNFRRSSTYLLPICSEDEEFQLLYLSHLELSSRSPHIPPEISLLTNLRFIALTSDGLQGPLENFVPDQVYQMSNLTLFNLNNNNLKGTIPEHFGLMTNVMWFLIRNNQLLGTLPTELGLMTSVKQLWLSGNHLTGTIPSELGLYDNLSRHDLYLASFPPNMTRIPRTASLVMLQLNGNSLTGKIPSELGLLDGMTRLYLNDNSLTGEIPSELGIMQNMTVLSLNGNSLSGTIPPQLGLASSLEQVYIHNNSLTGKIPQELDGLPLSDGPLLSVLTLDDNKFTGTVSEWLCSLQEFNATVARGLSVDCSADLCGCCWCPCPGSDTSSDCLPVEFVPSLHANEWPGNFPSPFNSTNVIEVNIHTDSHSNWEKAETSWVWSVLTEKGSFAYVDGERLPYEYRLFSYTLNVESNALYRWRVLDAFGDGICCDNGYGWLTITNSTPSKDHANGSVVWEAAGDIFESYLDIFIWVDPEGHSHHVEYVPGQGYVLPQDKSAEEESPIIVVPERTGDN